MAALREVAAAPGPVVATVTASSGLPDVAQWQIHRAAAGVTYAGMSASGQAKVTFVVSVPQPDHGLPPSSGMEMAASAYSIDDVLGALTADLQKAAPTTEVGTGTRGIHPLGGLAGSGSQLLCSVRDRLTVGIIQLTGKIQSLGMEPEDWAGVARTVGQCLQFIGLM